MKFWITKNIRFGYKYTINKNIRNQINSCLNEWLDDLITKKSKEGDILIINGGLFSNTSPSLIAIDDAHNFLKKVSEKIKVYLVNTEKDVRTFDNKQYSTLDIFSDIKNLVIIKNVLNIGDISIVPHDNSYSDGIVLNADLNDFKGVEIPNIIQLERTEGEPGVLVYDINRNKHIIVSNNFSPKHITVKINTLDDFSKISNKKDFIHVEVNNKIVEENKLKVNIELHNINAHSVKYVNINEEEITIDNVLISDNINIVDIIYNFIGDDENVKNHFERILKIHDK